MEGKQLTRRRSTRSRSRRKQRSKRSLLNFFLLTFIISSFLLIAFGAWKLYAVLGSLTVNDPLVSAQNEEEDTPQPIRTGGQTETGKNNVFAVALIGTDSRTGSGGTLNSDVMMVVVIDQDEKHVHLLSIPRDTKIQIPGYSGYRKANSAFALGEIKRNMQERNGETVTETGASLVIDMLEEYLEIPIDHYVHVGFQAVIDVIDAVGGVTIDVERSMIYDDPVDGTSIRINPGRQTLDGKNALDYVRHRLDNRGPAYYSSDFERNERQQKVIRAVADKVLSVEGVLNIEKIIEAATENIETSLTPDQMIRLAWDLKSLSSDNIFSIDNEAFWDSQQAFTIIPESRLAEIRAELKQIFYGES